MDWPFPLWVARRAAVSQPHVKVAVGPESERTAVMIRIWLVHLQKALFAVRARPVGVAILDPVPGDDGIAALVRVVDEELAVLCIAGVKGEAQQPCSELLLPTIADVEERLRQQLAVPNNAYPPGLFQDKQAPGAVPGVGKPDGAFQSAHRRRPGITGWIRQRSWRKGG